MQMLLIKICQNGSSLTFNYVYAFSVRRIFFRIVRRCEKPSIRFFVPSAAQPCRRHTWVVFNWRDRAFFIYFFKIYKKQPRIKSILLLRLKLRGNCLWEINTCSFLWWRCWCSRKSKIDKTCNNCKKRRMIWDKNSVYTVLKCDPEPQNQS